jgi:hypothetical protein
MRRSGHLHLTVIDARDLLTLFCGSGKAVLRWKWFRRPAGIVEAALLLLRLMVLLEQRRGAQGSVGGYSVLASLSEEHQHSHRNDDRAKGKERHQNITPAPAASLGLIVFKGMGWAVIHTQSTHRVIAILIRPEEEGNILCGRGNVQRR